MKELTRSTTTTKPLTAPMTKQVATVTPMAGHMDQPLSDCRTVTMMAARLTVAPTERS